MTCWQHQRKTTSAMFRPSLVLPLLQTTSPAAHTTARRAVRGSRLRNQLAQPRAMTDAALRGAGAPVPGTAKPTMPPNGDSGYDGSGKEKQILSRIPLRGAGAPVPGAAKPTRPPSGGGGGGGAGKGESWLEPRRGGIVARIRTDFDPIRESERDSATTRRKEQGPPA